MLTRLIPVTRTEARYVAALPGMPHGKHAQVLAAVPEGFRIAPARRQGGAAWLAALLDSADYRGLRRDRQANVRALAEFLSVARRYEHGILRPGLEALRAALPDVCAETVYRVLRWLRERRWLRRTGPVCPPCPLRWSSGSCSGHFPPYEQLLRKTGGPDQ